MPQEALIWIQAVAYLVSIAGTVGAAWFAICVLWPSIRRQNQLASKIERLLLHLEGRKVDDIMRDL